MVDKMSAQRDNEGNNSDDNDQALLQEHQYEWDDDYGFLHSPQPQRSLVRATAVTLLTLMTVVATVSLLTYRHHGAMFSGRMQLVSVSIVFRNGAQSSLTQQTWEDNSWPEGFGELTVEGMQQMYQLGQKFRQRYVDTLGFLPVDTHGVRDAVHMRSTALDRTEESAISVLLGLFDKDHQGVKPMPAVCSCRPQHGGEADRLSRPCCVSDCIGLPDKVLSSQIPSVHILPRENDWLLQQHNVCLGWETPSSDAPKFQKAVHDYRHTFDDAVEFLGADKLCSFKHDLNGNPTGRECSDPPLTLRDLEQLYQNLLNAATAKKDCPSDVGRDCRQMLAALHPIREFLWNYDFERANAVKAGGTLMGEILEHMKDARKWHMPSAEDPQIQKSRPPSMYFYSAEDVNVAALLGTLKAPWFHAPLYGSYVAFELWAPKTGDMTNEELWMVNVRYDGRSLKNLPGCKKGYCRFKDFFYSFFWSQAMYKEDCIPRS